MLSVLKIINILAFLVLLVEQLEACRRINSSLAVGTKKCRWPLSCPVIPVTAASDFLNINSFAVYKLIMQAKCLIAHNTLFAENSQR